MAGKFNKPTPVSFSGGMIIMLYLIMGSCLFWPNGLYMLVGIGALLIIIKLLWSINTPGVLIFAYVFQWLQVFFYIIWMLILGRSMSSMSPSGGLAFILAMGGLVIMAAVTKLVISRLRVYEMSDFIKAANQVNQRKLLILYIFSTIFLSGIGFVFGVFSGFAQVLVTISSLKWIFLLWLGAVIWVKNTHRWWLALIILYEFSVGLYSYFSSFKDVILYVVILSLTFISVIEFKQFLRLFLIGSLLGIILLTWSAIKGEYRMYLNQGTRQQTINVTRTDAINKLSDQINGLNYEKYEKSMIYTAYRLQYLYHFALSMDQVPTHIPFQNGSVWWETITYVTTPRILNPEKKAYSASVKASKFTGKKFAGLKEGTSFSLGYFADCYVDFGPIGMMFMLTLLSLFGVFIYKTFYNMTNLNLFFRFAIVNTSLYVFITFEADGLYLFGRMLTDFLVYYFLSKYLFPRLQKWIYN